MEGFDGPVTVLHSKSVFVWGMLISTIRPVYQDHPSYFNLQHAILKCETAGAHSRGNFDMVKVIMIKIRGGFQQQIVTKLLHVVINKGYTFQLKLH